MGIFGRKPNIEKMKASRDVKGLIKALKDKNADIRGKATEALSEIGDANAVEPLVASLRDENKNVRWRSAEALHNIGWEPKNEAERIALLIAMRRWDDLVKAQEPSISALIAAFNDPKVLETSYFLYPLAALWEIGEPAVPLLIDALRGGIPPVRVMAGLALGGIGDSRAIEPLVTILRDRNEDEDLRQSMGLALQCMGEAALEPMLAFLRSRGEDTTKVSAVINLGSMGEPAIKGLIDALRDDDVGVRNWAVFGLVSTGHTKAIEAIRSMPEEKDMTTRTDIATLLGFFDPPSLDRLLSMIKNFNDTNRRLAAIALGNTGDCNAVESLAHAARSDLNEGVRTSAIFSLGKLIECPGVRDTLLQMLRTDNVMTRMGVAATLKVSGVPVLSNL
jgi:HEAT repeat protein